MNTTIEIATPGGEEDQLLWFRTAGIVLSLGHFFAIAVFDEWRPEHLILDGAFLALAVAGPRSRRAGFSLLPFYLVGVAYDTMRYFVDFRLDVHIGDLYRAEAAWFPAPGEFQIWPEYFAVNNTIFLDILCGLAYLLYIYEVFAVGVLLLWKDRQQGQRFAWAFSRSMPWAS